MKKIIKITAITVAVIIITAVLTVGGYAGYVALQYYRIEDNLSLGISGEGANVQTGEVLSVTTYNLGFGAYSPEYSFFMDTGVMNDGTGVAGKYAKGMSVQDVEKNVNGQIVVSGREGSDFYFFQEADQKADRSYNIDMVQNIRNNFTGYASTYAENFHTAWLLYPFSDPMGTTKAGIVTLSKYNIESAVRRSFPLTDSFIDKLFDLDRCFSVHYLPVEGSDKKLVMIICICPLTTRAEPYAQNSLKC